jgi:hypothetical protein
MGAKTLHLLAEGRAVQPNLEWATRCRRFPARPAGHGVAQPALLVAEIMFGQNA